MFTSKRLSELCVQPLTQIFDFFVSSMGSTFFSIGTVAAVGAILSLFIWNRTAVDKLDGERA